MPSVTQVSSTQVPTVLVLLVTLPPPLVMPQERFLLVRLLTSSIPPPPLPPSVPLVEPDVPSVPVLLFVLPAPPGPVSTSLPESVPLVLKPTPCSVPPPALSNVMPVTLSLVTHVLLNSPTVLSTLPLPSVPPVELVTLSLPELV